MNDTNDSNSPTKTFNPVPDLPPFYKPHSQLEMVELRFAAIPGQPSILYWDSSNDTIVSICPTPQIGLVSVLPNTVCFVATVHRAKTTADSFTKDDAADYIERATNKIDIEQLAGDVEEATYNLALDTNAITDAQGTGYRAVICVPCTPDIFEKNLSLAMMQGQAAKRIAEAMASKPAGQTTH